MDLQFPCYVGTPDSRRVTQASHLDLQNAQLQEYAQRMQLGLRGFPNQLSGMSPLTYHGHLMNSYFHPYLCKDMRTRFVHEEPKPNHSYIGKSLIIYIDIHIKQTTFNILHLNFFCLAL